MKDGLLVQAILTPGFPPLNFMITFEQQIGRSKRTMKKTFIRMLIERDSNGATLLAQESQGRPMVIVDELDPQVAAETVLEMARERGVKNPQLTTAPEFNGLTVGVGTWFEMEYETK